MSEDGDGRLGREYLDPEPGTSLSLSTALSLVGEATRANILVALGEARTDPTGSNALAFSELMERVGAADSGGFNYHLDKLVGTFVEKSDAGYSLRLPGQLFYQAVVAGTLTERQRRDPFPVGDCPQCEGELAAAYHPDHLLTVACRDCERLFDAMHFPARGLDGRSDEELLAAASERRYHDLAAMRRGVCPACGGRVERALHVDGGVCCRGQNAADPRAELACSACNRSVVGNPAAVALTAPTVVGFFADHGRDAARIPWWEDPVATAMDRVETVGADSPAVAVCYDIGGDRLRVELTERLEVAASERIADAEI